MKTTLVTGGAGYVGSQACKVLREVGYEPICYDSLSSGHRWAVRWGPFEQGDILDSERLDAVLAKYQPDGVMHFAARARVAESVADPAAYYRTNVGGTLNLLDAMRRRGLFRLVYSSTCAVYGMPAVSPIPENAPRHPINPYGLSKLMVETILEQYSATYGLRYVALRYFNAAGADPDGDIGEDHEPETHLIPLVLQTAAGVREHVEIYGEDYDTPDGTCVRDYVHVRDIAHAHARALRYLEEGGPSVALNLGSSSGTSVKEIIGLAARIAARPIPLRSGNRRPGDPACLVADAARIHRELGWIPEHSDPETILRTAWAWHRRRRTGA